MTSAPTPVPRPAPRGHDLRLAALLVLVFLGTVIFLAVQHDFFRSSANNLRTQGSGVAAIQTRHLQAFDAVQLAGANTVVIRVGDRQSITVHADDNLLDRVTTRVETGNLVIGNAPGSFTTRSPMRVDITVPTLTALTLAGSGTISASGIDTSRLRVVLSGSGVIRAGGSTGQLEVTVPGSGDAQLEELVARDVDAVVNGSGRIVVTPTRSLHAEVPGSGAILYTGNPAHVTTSVTGSGIVSHG